MEPLGLYVVVARATTADGREDEAIGAVSVRGLSGDALANAIMKAETKAKRRVTLSIVGLGWTDESEVDSIPGAQTVRVDPETGEILDATPAQPAHEEKENGGVTGKQLKLIAVLLGKVGPWPRGRPPLRLRAPREASQLRKGAHQRGGEPGHRPPPGALLLV